MNITEDLKNKTVLVVGASGDIGEACSEIFLESGARVIMHANKNSKRLKRLLDKHPGSAFLIKCDATDESSVEEQFNIIRDDYGIKEINGLVNSTGDLLERKKVDEMDWDFTAKVLEVNIKPAFLFTIHCLPMMSDGSSIVFIASLTARSGKGDRSSVYGMSKGAIISWSKCLANELGPRGIRVNCLTPGYIQGQFHNKYTSKEVEAEHEKRNPLRRLGRPSDVARAALFYIADYDGYISGTTLDICGADYMC